MLKVVGAGVTLLSAARVADGTVAGECASTAPQDQEEAQSHPALNPKSEKRLSLSQ